MLEHPEGEGGCGERWRDAAWVRKCPESEEAALEGYATPLHRSPNREQDLVVSLFACL